MKNSIVALLKGTFLVSGDAPKNWLFIVFVSLLATVMIGSSHSADRKVHEIAALNEEVRQLRSEFVESPLQGAQRLKLESTIRQTVAETGPTYIRRKRPPKIIVPKTKNNLGCHPQTYIDPTLPGIRRHVPFCGGGYGEAGKYSDH